MLIEVASATQQFGDFNWSTIGTLGAAVVAGIGYLDTRNARKSKAVQDSFVAAINNQTTLLEAKLETKDAVNNLRIELAAVKQRLDDQHAFQVGPPASLYVREPPSHSPPMGG